MTVTDVVIVGAGPAGVAAAITLARADRDVCLVDKAPFPRDKICGDGLTAAALRAYEELGLAPDTVSSFTPVGDFSIRSPSGRWVHLELPTDGLHAAVARRADLDAAFLDVARAAGAKVIEGHAVIGATVGPDRVRISLDGGDTVEARYMIGADGMWSPTRKMLGATHTDGYRGEWHAFRQYHEGVTGPARDRFVVWFEPEILPGYVWSFPLGGGAANVGYGVLRGGAVDVGDMGRLWEDLRARPHVREMLGPDATPTERPRAWPIPGRIDRVELARGRALWAGDAAAPSDVMTGEGIAQALDTGRWAAEALLEAGPFDPAGAAADYERRVRRGLVADHRMSALLNRILVHRKGVRFPLWLADQSEWSRRNFARWLWEDYPRAVVATPRRWKPGVFTPPGAYQIR